MRWDEYFRKRSNVDTIPAKGQNVFAEGELVYGENVNPFILH